MNSEEVYAPYTAVPDNIDDLLDSRHPVTLLPLAAFTDQIVVPLTSLDKKIDRRAFLKLLFESVTSRKVSDQARVEAWVVYLQHRIAHPRRAPMLETGQTMYDPYWIIKNRLGQCGQVNRVVADGLEAVGYQTRIVQLKRHVAAEVWLNGAWSYLDADWLDSGQFVRLPSGKLASAAQIHKNPELLRGLQPGLGFKLYPAAVLPPDFPSYDVMFSVPPYYYYKTATREQEKNEHYGWNFYETVHE